MISGQWFMNNMLLPNQLFHNSQLYTFSLLLTSVILNSDNCTSSLLSKMVLVSESWTSFCKTSSFTIPNCTIIVGSPFLHSTPYTLQCTYKWVNMEYCWIVSIIIILSYWIIINHHQPGTVRTDATLTPMSGHTSATEEGTKSGTLTPPCKSDK